MTPGTGRPGSGPGVHGSLACGKGDISNQWAKKKKVRS